MVGKVLQSLYIECIGSGNMVKDHLFLDIEYA